jgi:glycosyltransferase involved in cell wall biosynthesis
MRSLILAKGLHPSWASGEASFAYNISKLLLNNNDEIYIVSSIDKRRQKTADNYDIERFNNFIKANNIIYKGIDNEQSIYDITTILNTNFKFDYIHIIYPNILPSKLKGLSNKYIKYIYTPSLTFVGELLSSIAYKKELSMNKDIYFAFTTEYLANRYKMSNNYNTLIIPPPIDLDIFKKRYNIDREEIINYLNRAKYKIGIENLVDKSNILLYMGLLLEERFPYKHILKAFKDLLKFDEKLFLLIIGREWDVGEENNATEIMNYANQLGISNNIAIALKELNEYIKINILSMSDIVLLPILNKRLNIPIVDPPIIMLEAMALENIIVASKFASIPSCIYDGHNGFLLNEIDRYEIYTKVKIALEKRDLISKEVSKLVRDKFSLQAVKNTLKKISD